MASTTTEFDAIGSVQYFTAGVAGFYDILAYGAPGGSDLGNGNYLSGGHGAMVGGDLYLQAGAKLEIVVGGTGGASANQGGGGGGGSFVIETYNGSEAVDVDELIAGGGGGVGAYIGGANANPNGPNGAMPQYTGGASGVDGAAGDGGGTLGGGGGGFTGGSGALNRQELAGDGATTGTTFAGGQGGATAGYGGFGGGGGGGVRGGGGGGGYGGGGGGSGEGINGDGGGGGGSFVNANVLNVVRYYNFTPSGFVEITGPLCFLRGARILTASGEVAVEALRVGDMAALARGGFAPIRWTGRARLRPAEYPVPAHLHPVRIEAGAFDEETPHRSLWLTPGHRVFVDGHLRAQRDRQEPLPRLSCDLWSFR